jgi:hypothetical protein
MSWNKRNNRNNNARCNNKNRKMTMFIVILHLSAYKYGTECSETSAYKIQTPGNYPEESTQQDEIKLEQYF